MPFVFVYIDNMLIFSGLEEEHRWVVYAVLQHLREAGLTVNPDRSTFFQHEVKFLSHRITPAGIFPLKKHADSLACFPPPTDRTSLLHFTGA